MNARGHFWVAVALAVLVAARLWAWLALGVAVLMATDGFLLWVHPYGACGDLFHRGGGRNIGSGDAAWGNCPRCHGKPVPRWGATAVAKLIGERYGRRYW